MKPSTQQRRKELVRMRLELHRQELRHESLRLLQPLQQVRGLGRAWQQSLGLRHAPLWGVAGVTLLGFLGGKGSRGLSRCLRLAAPYLPLAVAALRLAVSFRQPAARPQEPQSAPPPDR